MGVCIKLGDRYSVQIRRVDQAQEGKEAEYKGERAVMKMERVE